MKNLFKFICLAALGYAIYVILFGTPNIKTPAIINIPKGASVGEIANQLKNADLIRSKVGFETLTWLMRASSKLQAGEYKFDSNMSLADIVRVLTQGLGALKEKQFTTIEGWTTKEMGSYLEEREIVSKQDFLAVVGGPIKDTKSKIKDFTFLSDKPAEVGLEGYLFPDTYRVLKNADAEQVVIKMLENFDTKLTQKMRDDIKAQGATIFDIVRMASIVEAEAPKGEDRPIIAGILWKRLDAGMALQIDSSLNYFTGGHNAALRNSELKIDSPYNTYKYRGLPPTPIGNPGLSALNAAIYPTHTAYWYFMSGKDGTTHFAKTLDEHNENIAKYFK